MRKQELQSEKRQKLRHSAQIKPEVRRSASLGNQAMLSQLGTGRAMPEPIQAKMEESFRTDFSGVRLYESPLISDNGAQAVASGRNIAFAPGQLNFSSSKGLGLLGHELSHVASQARGEVSGQGFVNDSTLEHRADVEGAKAASAFDSLSGETLTPMSAAPAVSSLAGPMQAKKKKKQPQEEVPALDEEDLELQAATLQHHKDYRNLQNAEQIDGTALDHGEVNADNHALEDIQRENHESGFQKWLRGQKFFWSSLANRRRANRNERRGNAELNRAAPENEDLATEAAAPIWEFDEEEYADEMHPALSFSDEIEMSEEEYQGGWRPVPASGILGQLAKAPNTIPKRRHRRR